MQQSFFSTCFQNGLYHDASLIHPVYAEDLQVPGTVWIWRLQGASLMAQMVKNPPAMQKTRVRALLQEDPLEKGMATHSSVLAWRIPWTEEPGLQSMGSQRVLSEEEEDTHG